MKKLKRRLVYLSLLLLVISVPLISFPGVFPRSS